MNWFCLNSVVTFSLMLKIREVRICSSVEANVLRLVYLNGFFGGWGGGRICYVTMQEDSLVCYKFQEH